MKTPWRYFTLEELKCKCGKCGTTGLEMDASTMMLVDTLREACDFPLPVSSAYRCPTYNNIVSSTGRNGPHTTGKALDFAVDRFRAYVVLDKALALGFTGIGIKQKGSGRFIHLDTLTENETTPRPTVWSY